MIISKNTKIFLIAFSSLLLLITICSIIYKRTHKGTNESHIIVESAQKIPELSENDIYEQNYSNSVGTALNDVYANNGLKYEYVKDDEKKVNVSYVQITGLKDGNVEESINNQIKERINKILDSNNFKNNSDDSAYINTSVEANFSDILSVKIYAKFREDFAKCYGLNFRLDNGERIKINDLFVYDAPKRNIITQSAYRTFALSYYTDEGIRNDFYYNIEDDLINFLNDFNNGKTTEFSFSPLTLEIYKDGKIVTVDMVKWHQYIDIYTKFRQSNNLYDNKDDVATQIPVFVKRPDSIIDLYEKVNDSCILDVIIYGDEKFSEKQLKAIKNYKQSLLERLTDIRKEKGLYYSLYINVVTGKENNEDILIFKENECYAKVDEKDFLKDVYDKIITAERDLNNLNYEKCKIYFLDDDLLVSAVGQTKYSVKSGREFVVEEEPDEEEENIQEEHDIEDEEIENDIQEAIRRNEVDNNVRQEEEQPIQQTQEQPAVVNQTVEPTQRPSSPAPTPTPTPGNITTQVIY